MSETPSSDDIDEFIDQQCDAFESAWRQGLRPSLEETLSQLDAGVRRPAMVELIKVEIAYRGSIGEVINTDEYVARFPEFAAESKQILSSVHPSDGDESKTIEVDHPSSIQLAGEASDLLDLMGWMRDANSSDSTHGQPVAVSKIGRFGVVRRLGEGGFGVVYLARDMTLGRFVALKVPHAGVLDQRHRLELFLREGRASASLQHQNIVPVHETGEADGHAYIASQYCEGGSLAEWMASHPEPMPASIVAWIVRQLAEAVHHAHGRGVIHRDIKPSNVLLQKQAESASNRSLDDPYGFGWSPRLADFGLAKLIEEQDFSLATPTSFILGSPKYMSPEQARGDSATVGPATDVWALGILLYELLTRHVPFDADQPLHILQKLTTVEPVPPRRLRRDIPKDLETICLRCLEKDAAKRFRSGLELAEELSRFLSGEPIRSRPVPPIERVWKWTKRHPAIAASAIVALVSLTAALTMQYISNQRLAASNDRLQVALNESKEKSLRLLEQVYPAKIADAYQMYQNGDADNARRLLDELKPAPGEPDLRGIEWDFIDRGIDSSSAILSGHQGAVYACSLSPDESLLATGGADGMIILWDTATDAKRLVIPSGQKEVNDLAFRPDGQLLVSAGMDGTVKTWSVDDGQPVLARQPHADQVGGVAYSRTGRWLASSGEDGVVVVWDEEKKQEYRSERFDRRLTDVAWSGTEDVGSAVGVVGKTVDFYHDGNGIRFIVRPIWKDSIGVSADSVSNNPWIGLLTKDGNPRLFDPYENREVVAFEKPEAQYGGCCIAWSSTPGLLAASYESGLVHLWQVPRSTNAFSSHFPVAQIAVSPDEQLLAIVSPDHSPGLVDAGSQRVIGIGGERVTGVASVDFSPDGRWLASCDAWLELLDVRAHRADHGSPTAHEHSIKSQMYKRFAFFTADGKELLVFGTQLNDAFAIDVDRFVTSDGKDHVTRPLSLPDVPLTHLAMSKDRATLAALSGRDNVLVWYVGTEQDFQKTQTNVMEMNRVVLSPDAKWMAIGGDDGSIEIITHDLVKRSFRRGVHSSAVRMMMFSPDSTQLTTSSDAEILEWQIDGTDLLSPNSSPCRSKVISGQWLRDGRRIFGGATGFQTVTGDIPVLASQFEYDLRGHRSSARSVAISREGTKVWSVGNDQTVRRWDLRQNARRCRLPSRSIRQVSISPDGLQAGLLLDQWGRVEENEAWENRVKARRLEVVSTEDGKSLSVSAVDPDTKFAAWNWTNDTVASSTSKEITIRRLSDLAVVASHPTPSMTTALEFSPSGLYLAVSSNDGSTSLFHATDFKEIAIASSSGTSITNIAFSPNEKSIAVASYDGSITVLVFSKAVLSVRHQLRPHTSPIKHFVFARDGESIFSASDDSTIKQTIVTDGRVVRSLVHPGRLNHFALSDSEASLVSSDEKGVHCWRIPSGLETITILEQPANRIHLKGDQLLLIVSENGDTIIEQK